MSTATLVPETVDLTADERAIDTIRAASAKTLLVEFVPHHLRNVSGVSPRDFLDLIAPHFEHLLIPSLNRRVTKADFLPTLQAMFDQDQVDDGLIFTK